MKKKKKNSENQQSAKWSAFHQVVSFQRDVLNGIHSELQNRSSEFSAQAKQHILPCVIQQNCFG